MKRVSTATGFSRASVLPDHQDLDNVVKVRQARRALALKHVFGRKKMNKWMAQTKQKEIFEGSKFKQAPLGQVEA